MRNSIKNPPFFLTILLVTLLSCHQEENTLSQQEGIVRFGGISLEFEPMGSPGSRVMGVSPWKHIFPDAANLVFTNKINGQEYILPFNPKDFSTPYSITLPLGTYSYRVSVEGDVFSDFLPFEASGEFTLDSPSLEISLKAETDYGLVTVKDHYVETSEITQGNHKAGLFLPGSSSHWYIYVRGGTNATLKIKEALKGSTISRELSVQANRHYNFVLKLNDGAAIITDLEMDPFELEEEEIPIGFSSKFYKENGTIKCPGTVPGEKGMVDGKVYEAVDRVLLIQRRDEGADLTCVCTSLVTDMSELFKGKTWENPSRFNQDISSWDVSKVKDMSFMFYQALNFNQPIGNWDVGNVEVMRGMFSFTIRFNQPIGNWNVGNVKNMKEMFHGAWDFNQSIGNWDVGNVTDMSEMFRSSDEFNQPIGNWDVSNVTDMSFMFLDSGFDHPIGNWDVRKVTNMTGMFQDSYFNQNINSWDVGNVENMQVMFEYAWRFNSPIHCWDVSSVTNMGSMFYNSVFNQPIGSWDVSKVINMRRMFFEAIYFNQDLTSWCVQNILTEPSGFSYDSPLSLSNKPIWGTCPD
jgi:surface protein